VEQYVAGIKEDRGGTNLESLTTETELLLEPNTYGERELRSLRLPGALVSEIAFTL